MKFYIQGCLEMQKVNISLFLFLVTYCMLTTCFAPANVKNYPTLSFKKKILEHYNEY